MAYRILVLVRGQWTDDVDYLGCTEEKNRFASLEEALAAIADLAAGGFDAAKLRADLIYA